MSSELLMAKARPSSTDIDRFLEEVNRRKQQQARQSAPAPQPIQRTAPKPAVATPPAPKMAKVQQKQVMTSEPVIRAVVLESSPEPVISRDYATKTTFQPPTPQAMPRTTESGAVHQVKSMLKSKEGLRAMFVMNEILSPPLSRRPRSR